MTQEQQAQPVEEQQPVAPQAKSPRVRPWVKSGGLHRVGGNLVTVGVGAVAGYLSWMHLYALGQAQPDTLGLSTQQHEQAAALTPFAIDGMILAGTLKLRQARVEGRPAPPAAYAAVVFGVALTMAGNIASAPNAFWAQVLAAAPPGAFLVCVEILTGRPMTQNLWDVLRGWLAAARRRRLEHAAARDARPAKSPVDGEPVKTVDPRPIAVEAEPQPMTEPPDPTPEPRPAPAVRSIVPPPTPVRPRPAPRKAAAAPAAPPEPEVITGTKTRPERRVGGVILSTEALKADARQRLADQLNGGAAREGLGTWVSRQYDPPMSPRWGQERLAEVVAARPAATVEPEGTSEPEVVDGTGLVLIDPETPAELAEPIDGRPRESVTA